jgi:glycosyltransferase involved in cell wall biosynthesis
VKVLLINNSDQEGGAARAAFRLQQGLCSWGVDSSMLVQVKSGSFPSVIGPSSSSATSNILSETRLILDKLPLTLSRIKTKSNFSIQWIPDNISSQIKKISPDIINLHWINNGFIQIESLAKLRKPIVWTMHDMWAFTGGCHYSQDCNRYQKNCGACPQLASQKNRDLSSWVWRRKAKAWRNLDLTLVSPSHWLADCAKSSSLFANSRIEVIPNGIDPTTYRPFDKMFAREVLGLPKDKYLILFGALSATSDRRKGFHLLQPALEILKGSDHAENIELVIFGSPKPQKPPDLAFKTHYMGTLKDDVSLALVYSAADVFILPSVQDNLPNTVLEALACGLPCVAFNIGGAPDMVVHQWNGVLAEPYSYDQLAKGISWVIESEERKKSMSENARTLVMSKFTIQCQAKAYLSLFRELAGQVNN